MGHARAKSAAIAHLLLVKGLVHALASPSTKQGIVLHEAKGKGRAGWLQDKVCR